jgi:pimeloyl-ACP methyl ester carboxylesterase
MGRGGFTPVAAPSRRLAASVAAPGGAVMCYTHLPAGPARGAVVVCSPLFMEGSENVPAELLLAEALVELGFAVQRFDYRSCGNSFGDPQELTLKTATLDCLLAAARLREHANTDALGVVGTRWGALVAAGVAGPLGARAVAFWEAKADGRGYVDELARTRAFYDLWRDERHPAGYHQQRLAAGQPLNVLAWRVYPALAASCLEESVAGRLRVPIPARVVHGRGREADSERLTADVAALGCPVTTCVLDERVLWWAGVNRLLHPEHPPAPLEVEAAETARWLTERLSE